MLKKMEKGFYVLEKFSRFPELIHGFSTRDFGNMKFGFGDNEAVIKNREKFAQAIGFDPERIVEAEQVHGAKTAIVGKSDFGKAIEGVDGLLASDKGVFLLIKTADCVPILFYDPVQKVIGAAHAGWKGTLARIGSKMVKLMQTQFDCEPKDVLAGLGPSIGGCCYSVPRERALGFQRFGEGTVWEKEGKWHLDLRKAVYNDLIQAGLLPSNIEVSNLCTSCQSKDFFSFRKEGENLVGEMAAVVGMTEGLK